MEGSCPPELEDFGKEIVSKCQGFVRIFFKKQNLLSHIGWERVFYTIYIVESPHE